MKNKIKLWLLVPMLFVGSFYFADKALADNQEPILIQISDTDIGTTAFEQLIQYGNGGHSAMGTLLGEAQNMETNPGIGFSIGSGGNGYRPSIIIAVWTDQPFDSAAALATIKSHLNVPTNPVTTNGDCAIACDGTYQEEPTTTTVVVNNNPEPVVESSPQPEPEPQAVYSSPVLETTTTTTILLDEKYSSQYIFEPTIAPVAVLTQPKIMSTKKIVPKKKIIIKKVVRHATNKTTR